MGCGMVDLMLLQNCGIDPEEYSGYAFGMGIERIAMLLYQIGDIRMFYENDLRFAQEQFRSEANLAFLSAGALPFAPIFLHKEFDASP